MSYLCQCEKEFKYTFSVSLEESVIWESSLSKRSVSNDSISQLQCKRWWRWNSSTMHQKNLQRLPLPSILERRGRAAWNYCIWNLPFAMCLERQGCEQEAVSMTGDSFLIRLWHTESVVNVDAGKLENPSRFICPLQAGGWRIGGSSQEEEPTRGQRWGSQIS